MSVETRPHDVIVADNDYVIRNILRSLLANIGFNVLQAVDGLEAIDYAARVQACLVILDLKMPKLDGFATCSQIRRLPGYAAVPIAILSAYDSSSTRQAATRAGADRFLAKPFKPIDVLRVVVELLNHSSSRDGSVPGLAEPAVFVWTRQPEPARPCAERTALAEGRRVLQIFSR